MLLFLYCQLLNCHSDLPDLNFQVIYLCKGELDENLGDDYDQIIFVSNSDQIFSDIMKYFKNLYENGKTRTRPI